jgi:LysM repeat protein
MLFWLGATGGAQAASHRAGPGAAHRGLSQVVVQPGQTLWSIARRAEPAADPRGVVQQIIEVNAMGSPTIQAGQLLWVPRG